MHLVSFHYERTGNPFNRCREELHEGFAAGRARMMFWWTSVRLEKTI